MKGNEMGRTCSTSVQKKNIYKTLVGKPKEIRQIWRLKRRLEDILMKSNGVVRIEFSGLG